jgi:phosphoribosyl 1,2-cyclic phosphodiesterase
MSGGTVWRIGVNEFAITFFGVRGSTPCHGPEIERYGGNTSCVAVRVPEHDPIMLDLGTGSRYLGQAYGAGRPFDGTCLLSHLHWDHVQGLPFFPPILNRGSRLEIHAPVQPDGRSLREIFLEMWCPPTFPVGIDDLPCELSFAAHGDEEFAIGDVKVTSRLVPHIGNTLGYRLEWDGRSVVYISDHQQPGVDVYETTTGVRELCEGADLLIHDAQYTRAEFRKKATWGHCTVDYAIWLAGECDVKTLALYHHDPLHDDRMLDVMADEIERTCDGSVEVVIAREGQTLVVGGNAS